MMENVHRIPTYCEICKDVYLSNGIVIVGESTNINITNSSLGRCPKDGGRLIVPDGSYSIRDEVMEFVSQTDRKEIYDILSVLEGNRFKTIREVKNELEKIDSDTSRIVEWIYQIFKVTNSLDLALKLVITLMMLGSSIAVEEVYDNFTTSDDELRQMEILKNQREDKKRDEQIINKLDSIEKRMQYKDRKSTVVSKKKKGKKNK